MLQRAAVSWWERQICLCIICITIVIIVVVLQNVAQRHTEFEQRRSENWVGLVLWEDHITRGFTSGSPRYFPDCEYEWQPVCLSQLLEMENMQLHARLLYWGSHYKRLQGKIYVAVHYLLQVKHRMSFTSFKRADLIQNSQNKSSCESPLG